MTENLDLASVVGRYLGPDGKPRFLPSGRAEADRAAESYARTIATFGFERGRYVLVISTLDEAVQVGPFEAACMDLGLLPSNADYSAFEAGRVEAIIRRFDAAAVFGVGAAVLEGLRSIGKDPATVFAGRVVWARQDVYDEVAAMPGVTARRMVHAGPALALGCSAFEGVHLDGREWSVEIEGAEVLISSRLPRAMSFQREPTGLRGRLGAQACACGNHDPLMFRL